MLRFDGQVALITGAGRGIGRQHAISLAERGALVVVNNYGVDGRGEHGGNTGPADSVVAEIRATGGQTMAACCDIGDRAQAEQMVDAVIAQWGRIDMLIHNASTYADLGAPHSLWRRCRRRACSRPCRVFSMNRVTQCRRAPINRARGCRPVSPRSTPNLPKHWLRRNAIAL